MRALWLQLWERPSANPLVHLLLLPLWLLSLAYRAVAARRIRAGGRPGRAVKVEAKVISVGNLTAGGAGKTPVVIHLARRLLEKGERPLVLSRGWGREGAADLMVSDGGRILAGPRLAGDEPLLIARRCPGATVVVARQRAQAARALVREGVARTILLDDGFQHTALARDADVVVVDAASPFGNGHLLPRGPLREPKRSLERASLLWISKVEQAGGGGRLEALRAELARWSPAPVVTSAYRAGDVLDDRWQSLGAAALSGRRVVLMAGIARPSSFRATLAALGAEVIAERAFSDHHWFRPMEVEDVKLQARRLGADAIALTEKDALRLPDSACHGPFAIVRIEVEIRTGQEAVAALIG